MGKSLKVGDYVIVKGDHEKMYPEMYYGIVKQTVTVFGENAIVICRLDAALVQIHSPFYCQ